MKRPLVALSIALALIAGAVSAIAGASGGAASASLPRCFGAASRDPVAPCRNPALVHVVRPAPDAAMLEPSEPCTPVAAPLPACSFGVAPDGASDAFALVGDSHAVHWRAALMTVADAAGWTGYSMTRSTCPFTLPVAEHNPRCRGFARGVLDWLSRRSDIHVLFVSGNASHPPPGSAGYIPLATRVRNFERAFRAVPPTITRVFVIHDVPHASIRTEDCLRRAIARGLEAGTVCARSRASALPGDPAFIAARALGGRFAPVDLTGYMCGRSWCYPVVGGALVIKDIGHLTRTFARTLGPYLWRAVRAALASPTAARRAGEGRSG